jgi:hypothetical protein
MEEYSKKGIGGLREVINALDGDAKAANGATR